jgi:sec-independent protein translocase protein TatC
VAPGLYPHERKYVTPFIALSSIFFVLGVATAYYLIFPPAAKYLLGLGSDFRLLLKADDYFDFIILLMLGMGGVAQMPAITYVLARMGLVTAGWMVKVWRVAFITILIAAAVISPTNDAPVRGADVRALRDFDCGGVDLRAQAGNGLKNDYLRFDIRQLALSERE